MEKPELMKKLDAMLARAERDRMYGSLEIEIRDGKAVIIRTVSTEKLESIGKTNRANKSYR